MKFSLTKEQDSTFSFVLSILIHAFIFLFVLTNINIFESLAKYDLLEEDINKNNEYEYVFLIETPDKEEEENEDSIFASDKSLKQIGLDNVTPDVFVTDQSTFSVAERTDFFDMFNENQNNDDSQDFIDETLENENENKNENKIEGAVSRGSEPKIPATFDEGISRAVVLSSETGVMQLGTKTQKYYWYFKSLVESIHDSWLKALPSQAHYLGLLKSDNVDVLISIDINGNVAFEKFLKRSDKGQTSLDSSCEKAIEHASSINPPPESLLRDWDYLFENGKIYLPFKFFYRNSRN